MKYMNCCRTCLETYKDMRNINSSVPIAGIDVPLTDILEIFYNYKVSQQDSSLPENICINCVNHLIITYSFKKLIESSLQKLTSKADQLDLTTDNYDGNYESEDEKPLQHYKHKVSDYIRPIRKRKEEINSLFCAECKLEFETVKLLSEHCSNNHPIKCTVGRDCDYCEEKFEDFRSLVLHKKLHIRPFLCENCWDGFYTEEEMIGHSCLKSNMKDVKKPERVLRQCDQCGKSYPPGYIRIHSLIHSNDRQYSCMYCPKKFKVPGGLHSHIQWNHKRTRNHKCEVCNATFISSSSRSTHIRKNHLKEKKYACNNCGKRFFSKSELQRHTLTHTGVKNFHCHMCDKSYQTRYGLNCHLKSHYS